MTNQDRPEPAAQQRSHAERQMLPPISSFAAKDAPQRLSPNARSLHRVPSSDDAMRIQRPLSASSQVEARDYYQPRTHLGPISPHMDAARRSSPSGMDRIMHEAPARSSSYHRHSESGPSGSYRDDWAAVQDRAANEAYARRMEEARWLEERNRRPEGAYYAPNRDDMDEDVRHLKRRGTFSTLGEHRMYTSSHPAAGPRSYSPPDNFVHHRPPIEAPRPASAVGVMAVPGGAPTASPSTASSGTSTVNANRRVAHLLSEQKRRESINTGFEDLRQAIPTCRDGQDSKATILRRALEYIRELESIVDHSHRVKAETHSMGGFDTRSPPDDQDGLRRLGRPGDSSRGDPRMNRRAPNGGDTPSGPHIGGMPGNSYGLHHAATFTPRNLPMPRYAQAESRLVQATTQGSATHIKEESSAGSKRPIDDEELRDTLRRRISNGSSDSPDSSHSSSSGARYTVAHTDSETVPASFGMRALHPSPSLRTDADKPRQAARLIHC